MDVWIDTKTLAGLSYHTQTHTQPNQTNPATAIIQAPDSKVLGPFLSKVPSGVAGPLSLVCLMVVRAFIMWMTAVGCGRGWLRWTCVDSLRRDGLTTTRQFPICKPHHRARTPCTSPTSSTP